MLIFLDIQNNILHALDKARVSIVVVMAWFTNEVIAEKLIKKRQEGLVVKVRKEVRKQKRKVRRQLQKVRREKGKVRREYLI